MNETTRSRPFYARSLPSRPEDWGPVRQVPTLALLCQDRALHQFARWILASRDRQPVNGRNLERSSWVEVPNVPEVVMKCP
jgi:hypothetical protein